MIARLLIILMLVAQPLVYAADWACRCTGGSAQNAVATNCNIEQPGCEAECCGGDSTTDSPFPDIAAGCPSPIGRPCSAYDCACRPGLPTVPIAPKSARIATEHWALAPVFSLPSARAGFGVLPIAAADAPAHSWLARCTDANARRIALCSWTT